MEKKNSGIRNYLLNERNIWQERLDDEEKRCDRAKEQYDQYQFYAADVNQYTEDKKALIYTCASTLILLGLDVLIFGVGLPGMETFIQKLCTVIFGALINYLGGAVISNYAVDAIKGHIAKKRLEERGFDMELLEPVDEINKYTKFESRLNSAKYVYETIESNVTSIKENLAIIDDILTNPNFADTLRKYRKSSYVTRALENEWQEYLGEIEDTINYFHETHLPVTYEKHFDISFPEPAKPAEKRLEYSEKR